jgi:DHA1 family bicyclomycin/chloramphenicol resistance-like MFS transporter
MAELPPPAPPVPSSAPAPAAVSPASPVALLVLLGALTAIAPMSMDMYLPAFPQIAAEYGVSQSPIQLSLTACMVGMACGQLFAGPLTDRHGRRAPVALGIAVYAVASLLCALAPSPALLAAFRLVQGFSGGVGIVVGRAVVRDLYSGVAAAKYFSRLIMVSGIAPVVAPVLGSQILRVTTWRGVFVLLALLGVLLTAAVAWRLPETLPPDRRTHTGAAHPLRAALPLLADRVYVGYTLAQGFAFAGMFAYISGSSFVVQDVYGATAQVYSLMFAANSLGQMLLGQTNAHLLGRFSSSTLLRSSVAFGLLVTTLLLAALLAGFAPLAAVGVLLFGYVSTIGMTTPNTSALAMDPLPPRGRDGGGVDGRQPVRTGRPGRTVGGAGLRTHRHPDVRGDALLRGPGPGLPETFHNLAVALLSGRTVADPRRDVDQDQLWCLSRHNWS